MHRLLLSLFILSPLLALSQLTEVELPVKKIPVPVLKDSSAEQWNQSQASYRKLRPQAMEMLYWTNLCRSNPRRFWDSAVVPLLKLFPKLNKTEAKSLELDLKAAGSLPMFTLNDKLIRTAQSHADDIAGKRVRPSHNSSDGTEFGTRMKLAGIRNCANENIALSSQGVLLTVVLLYLDIDNSSMGHRRALLDPNLREIGIGSTLYGQDQYFLVQDFACTQ